MPYPKRKAASFWLCAALLLGASAVAAGRPAQEQTQVETKRPAKQRSKRSQETATEPAYQPVTFSWEGGRIELLEAVRLTLEHDPNLLLREQDTVFQLGIAQELAGAFDLKLTGDFSFEHREQELRESTKRGERDKRRQIADVQAIACQFEDDLEIKLADLQAAAGTNSGVRITTDAGFDAQLRLLEAVIAAAPPGQQAGLQATRQNFIATELAETQDAEARASQACTDAGDGLARLGEVPEEEEFDIGRFRLRLEKLTHGGILWAPFINASYDSTQFIGKRNGFFVPALDPFGQPLVSPSGIPLERAIDFGGKNVEDLYAFEVGFEVNVPLLRNRGVDAVAAPENAARIDYDASELILAHSASESVLNTTFAYWNLVAAQDQVGVLEGSVALERQVLEITRALIEADELPAADLDRALAGEANSLAQLESSQRELTTARLDLVKAMGLSVDGEENAPGAGDAFPLPPSRNESERTLDPALVQEGLVNRLDLQSTRMLIESGKVLARAAVINLKPQFDVTLGAWANSRGEGGVSQATDNWTAPSFRAKAFLEKPFGNNSARGFLVQREAQLKQREISYGDLDRQVRIGIVRTANALVDALDQLAYAEQAARSFEQTTVTEFEKLRLGETTILDAILTEQQRTSSFTSLIQARFQVATLIAQLRFETGTLVEQDGDQNRVTEESLTSLPYPGGSR